MVLAAALGRGRRRLEGREHHHRPPLARRRHPRSRRGSRRPQPPTPQEGASPERENRDRDLRRHRQPPAAARIAQAHDRRPPRRRPGRPRDRRRHRRRHPRRPPLRRRQAQARTTPARRRTRLGQATPTPRRAPAPPAVVRTRRRQALPHRRHPLARAHRDPPHARLRNHGLRQDRPHRRPRRADTPARRALRHLRQDGKLRRDLLRSPARRPSQSPRRSRPTLVALPRSPRRPRLRHHGCRPHPPPEGRRRPLLDHRRTPAVLPRRRRVLETGRDPQPSLGRTPAQDQPRHPRRGHGGHRGAVLRRSRQPQDRALRPRHAHRQHRRPRTAPRPGNAVLHPRLDRERRRRRVPVPDLAGRSARQPPGPDLHLARDRRQRAAVAAPRRRTAHLDRP